MIDTGLHAAAVVAGLFGVFVFLRSAARMLLLNRRERDIVERCARFAAVRIMHGIVGNRRDCGRVQRVQAWTIPVYILCVVVSWFLLVQIAFSFMMWGVHAEPDWSRSFASSGSALSTLGFLTPSSVRGEFMAIYEAAIGLAVVILLFTFVPSYQAAIQVRERRVGWLYSRTGQQPTSTSLLESFKRSGQFGALRSVWEDWEVWFRGLLETHSIAPILAYVPSVYRGTTWVGAAAAVLDATSLLLCCRDPEVMEAARTCRAAGCHGDPADCNGAAPGHPQPCLGSAIRRCGPSQQFRPSVRQAGRAWPALGGGAGGVLRDVREPAGRIRGGH